MVQCENYKYTCGSVPERCGWDTWLLYFYCGAVHGNESADLGVQ